MHINNKNIFLIDTVGASLSAILIGFVLPAYGSWIGLPTHILYFLAMIAFAFSIYSFCCFQFVKHPKKFLFGIMLANLIYCVLTAAIVMIHSAEITTWGCIYFTAEILVILALVAVEWNVFQKIVR